MLTKQTFSCVDTSGQSILKRRREQSKVKEQVASTPWCETKRRRRSRRYLEPAKHQERTDSKDVGGGRCGQTKHRTIR
jgi:hypothetical protein